MYQGLFVILHYFNFQGEAEVIIECDLAVFCGADKEMNLVYSAVNEVQHVVVVDILKDDVVEGTGIDHQLCKGGTEVKRAPIPYTLVNVAVEQVTVKIQCVSEHHADCLDTL